MEKMPDHCPHYSDWDRESTILNIKECCHYSPYREVCHCPQSEFDGKVCPWEGYQEEPNENDA
jgi:hypothetical protein